MRWGLLFAMGWGLALQAQAAALQVQVRDAQGQPLAGAVLALERSGAPERAKPGTQAEMAQKGRQFAPQLLVVQTGTQVLFPNLDPVRHHVYSYSAAKSFELKLFLGQPPAPVLFDKAGVAAVGCNIHDRMAAHIVVVDTPAFAISDAQGQARLEPPPGQAPLLLRAWHPQRTEPSLISRPVPAGADQMELSLP